MNRERLLLDTVFIQALLNRRDQYHAQAQAILPRVRNAGEVWVTEAVLIEVGNALSAVNRTAVVQFNDFKSPAKVSESFVWVCNNSSFLLINVADA